MVYCTSCGEQLEDTMAYCPKCGSPNRAPGAPQAAAAGQMAVPENVAGMLCYIFLAGIIFLLVEPYSRNRFVRFHAFQSILLTVVWLALHGVVMIPWIGWAIWPLLELGFFIAWVVLLIKAYQGVLFKLPVIGDFAAQHAG